MRFLFAGDSITEGMTPALGRYMASLGVRGEIVYQSGISVEGMVADELLLDALRTRTPTAVVVMLGTNPDGHVAEETFRGSVRALRNLIRRYCDRQAWIGPWAGEQAGERMRIIRQEIGWRVADGVLLAGNLARAGENRVHFTSEAYPSLAWRVAEWSVRVGDSRALTRPRSADKMVAAIGVLGSAAVPVVAGLWR